MSALRMLRVSLPHKQWLYWVHHDQAKEEDWRLWSGKGARSHTTLEIKIDYKTIPLFDGVCELFQKGYFASIAGKNYASLSAVLSADVNNQHFPALFDPQTSGGLLFSVPSHQTEDCLKALYQNGVSKACVIGEVIDENKIIILWLNAGEF